MLRRLKPLLIALAVLIPLGTVGILHPGRSAEGLEGPGRIPGPEEWSTIAYELEDQIPARALLGGIRDDLLDRRLAARGISWDGFRRCTRDLVSRTSQSEAANRSGLILADAMARSADQLPVEIKVLPEPEDRRPLLDDDIAALVRRLLARLPGES